MQKSQPTTASSLQTSRNNEAHLLQLVKNLELQLGYHAIALRKAEQMIKLLKNQNKVLFNQNQVLRLKCQQLEFRIVKYQNQLSVYSQASSGMEYMQCVSPSIPIKKYPHIFSQLNIQPQKTTSSRSISKYQNKPTLDPETPNRKKYNPLFKSNQFIQMPQKNSKDNSFQILSPMKKKKRNEDRLKNDGQSCKFIPFQQLEFSVHWK